MEQKPSEFGILAWRTSHPQTTDMGDSGGTIPVAVGRLILVEVVTTVRYDATSYC